MSNAALPAPPPRQLQKATDADLARLVRTHPFVMVAFMTAGCALCRALVPAFEACANDLRFAPVLFLHVDAAENPVAAKAVSFISAPFVATYRAGRLLYYGTALTESWVEKLITDCLLAAEVPDQPALQN